MNTRGRPSKRCAQVLMYVGDTVRTDGQAPSYTMICRALGIGTRQEVSRIVGRLEAAGKLRRTGAGKVRRIGLVELC